MCIRDSARTLQRQGNRKLSDLATLRLWLIEHLGVAYRGYLELDPVTLEPSAKIAVTVGQSSMLVPPIQVPMMMARTEKLEVELSGQIVPVIYVHGTLDKSKRDHLVLGGKARYYYQGTQPTQGIDIRLGKRVIATAQLGEIWRKEDGSASVSYTHLAAHRYRECFAVSAPQGPGPFSPC